MEEIDNPPVDEILEEIGETLAAEETLEDAETPVDAVLEDADAPVDEILDKIGDTLPADEILEDMGDVPAVKILEEIGDVATTDEALGRIGDVPAVEILEEMGDVPAVEILEEIGNTLPADEILKDTDAPVGEILVVMGKTLPADEILGEIADVPTTDKDLEGKTDVPIDETLAIEADAEGFDKVRGADEEWLLVDAVFWEEPEVPLKEVTDALPAVEILDDVPTTDEALENRIDVPVGETLGTEADAEDFGKVRGADELPVGAVFWEERRELDTAVP